MTTARTLRPAEQPDAHYSILDTAVEPWAREDFIPPDPKGLYSLPPCAVVGCGRVSADLATVICRLHGRRWAEAAAQASFDEWLRDVDPKPSWTVGDHVAKDPISRGIFILQPLSGRLRLEMAYALQRRGTIDSPRHARPAAFNHLVEQLSTASVRSVLDLDPRTAASVLGLRREVASVVGLVTGAQSALRGLLGLPGRRTLGPRVGGSGYFVDFEALNPPWLAPLVRRWTEYRLATEKVAAQTAGMQVSALARFGAFLDAQGILRPEDLTRDVMIDYLAYLKALTSSDGSSFSPTTIGKWSGTAGQFLDDVRAMGWAPSIPGSARYLAGELPRRPPPQPRYISEYVMRQIESPESLALMRDPDARVALQIIMTTGLRMSHALGLEVNCLEMLPRSTGPAAWSLLYLDTKTNQAMRVPLRDDVAEAIRRQQEGVRERFGDDCRWLIPSRRSHGTKHYANNTFHTALQRWCLELSLQDENGAPVRVTSHQFRHTCGTRWINNNVPERVVMKLLGHRTSRMTQVYSHLFDETVRREWEAFQRVDIHGTRIAPPTGEAAEVEWLIENLSRATQALPNGYCTLPIQKSCPHANACLDCDSFATGPEFLPVLEAQLEEHRTMIEKAEAAGFERVAEINRKPFVHLSAMIAGLKRLVEEPDAGVQAT